jgi:colanic acid biosynthesis glycosyl transferase WcaI
MQKRVLLIGGNFYPEPIGIGKYNGEMIEWLTENGYKCTVITSFPYYPQWKVQKPYVKSSFWYKKEVKYYKPYYDKNISIYRCPQYVPNKPTGLKRILNGLSFFLSSLPVIFKLLFEPKYDYVISVVPSFETGLLGILYKSIRGGKFLYHIQDLQIDAARDLKILKSPVLINLLFKVEKYILKHADVVSSVSSGMMEKVNKKCNKKIDFFPNWVDNKVIFPILDKETLKEEFGFKKTDKLILYSGAVGEKQGLENILFAAKSFMDQEDVQFLICGSGPYLNKLKELKTALSLNNITFISTQPIEKLNKFLNMADLHLIIQKADASDLVMPSKLTNILAVGGVSIVTGKPGSTLYELIVANNIGVVVTPDHVEELVGAIRKTIHADNQQISTKALEYAAQNFAIGNIIANFSQHMKGEPDVQYPELVDLQINSQLVSMEA